MAKTALIPLKTNKIYSEYGGKYEGRFLFLFGGGGSGKSIYGIQKFCKRLIEEKDGNHKFLFIRKVAATIRESIFDATKGVLDEMGVLSLCEINKTDKTIIFSPNGNRIIMVGLDDVEKLKSIAGITGIFIEEATELEEVDFLQVNLRLRGETRYYKQIIAAFNPIKKEHWILKYVEPQLLDSIPKELKNLHYLCEDKVWEFDKEIEDSNGKKQILTTRVLNTTYKDNRFIDEDYKITLQLLSHSSETYAEVYERGRWGEEKSGDLFVFQFDAKKHIGTPIRNEGNVLHFTVDFNVRPYMSGLVIELEYIKNGYWGAFTDYWQLKVVKEFANVYPSNTAYDLGASFDAEYNMPQGFYLYGDASGLKNLGIKDTKTHFHDLIKGLGKSGLNVSQRVPTQNPRYKSIAPNSLGRKAFINLLFSGQLPVRIIINKDCTNFISDLKYCLQDGNGGLLKKKNKDGIEERGHHLDAFQYFVCHPETLGYLAKL